MRRIKFLVCFASAVALLMACTHGPDKINNLPATSGLSRILQKGELAVGTTGKQPPLNGIDETGKVIGMEADLARMMASALGVTAAFKTMPFFELLPALEAGKVDLVISGMTITPKRNSKVAFVGRYFVSGKSFVAKAHTVASLKDPDQINRPETILATLKGSTSQSFVENVLAEAKLILTEDHQEALRLVIEGKAHAMIADHHVCILSVLLFPEEELVALDTPLTYEPFGIALPGDDPLLINLVGNFVDMLEGSGDLEKLREQWFKELVWGKELLLETIWF
jgi:polar amino acid transport system substrate-binding protein